MLIFSISLGSTTDVYIGMSFFCSSHDTCLTRRPGNATYSGAHQVDLSFAIYLNVPSSEASVWVYALSRATIDYIPGMQHPTTRTACLYLYIYSSCCAAAKNNTRYLVPGTKYIPGTWYQVSGIMKNT